MKSCQGYSVTKMLETIKKYQEADISIVPLKYGTKKVSMQAYSGQRLTDLYSEKIARKIVAVYQKRKPYFKEVEKWLKSRINIGLVTGYKQVIAVDFDDEKLFHEWKKMHQDIAKSTPIQKTNKGYHILFRVDSKIEQLKAKFNNKYIGEVLGTTSWIAIYPSVHPTGTQYKWLKGQSPWEMEIYHLKSLEEIDIIAYGEAAPFSQFITNIMRFNFKSLSSRFCYTLKYLFKQSLEKF